MDDSEKKSLSVLYQSSNTYVLPTGVSLASLFSNCTDIDSLYIYLLDDGIQPDNKAKLDAIAKRFDRKIEYVETSAFKEALAGFGIQPFCGSYATYFKLLALRDIAFSTNQVLYIDGDTIIDKPLSELIDVRLEKNQILSAVIDLYLPEYKSILGIPLDEPYFNCGVLLIDKEKWVNNHCTDKIINHLKNERCNYSVVDQDIINVLFRNSIKALNPRYNFNPAFYMFGVGESFDLYDMESTVYYSKDIIREVISEGPAIYHCLGGMSGRPWEKDNYHPQNDLFDKYLLLTEWRTDDKYIQNKKPLFKMQSLAYRTLPKSLYLKLHGFLLKKYLHQREKSC